MTFDIYISITKFHTMIVGSFTSRRASLISKERMSIMRTKVLLSVLVLFSLLVSCNMPGGQLPATQAEPPEVERVSSNVDVVGTAVELTSAARLTEIAGSVTPTFTVTPTLTFTPTSTIVPTSSIPTQCNPQITASVNANVRSGPGTAYDVVGSLSLGQTATIVGRNDAYTWWYVDYPGISGGHAWIAGSVVTSACVPSVVQVVAAPALPTDVPTDVPTKVVGNDALQIVPDLQVVPLLLPDLIVSEFTITPATPTCKANTHVRIGVYNQGKAASGQFTVVWYGLSTAATPSCSWTVDKTNAKGGKILECDYAFQSWYPVDKTSLVIVDSNNQVAESNEGNNQGSISPFGVNKPCP
jgi:hypothetical protein